MGKAQCVKVLFADEQQCGVVDCRRRCRIASAVKDRQLRHRATRPVYAEHMLASTGGTLEDTDVPGFDHVHAQARFTFAENNLSRCIVARNSALQEESEFALGQPGKDRDLRQRLTVIDFVSGTVAIVSEQIPAVTSVTCTLYESGSLDYKTRSRQEGSVEPQLDFNERPFIVIWETTQACDLACVHCRACAQPVRSALELSTDEAKRLIDEVSALKAPVFVLTGGDPLKRPDIFELVEYASSHGVRISLTPSATPLLTQEAIRQTETVWFGTAGHQPRWAER